MAQVSEERIQLPALADDDGEVTADTIVFAVQKTVELANPIKVIAFGSRARGDHRAGSDLDLAVIVDKYDKKVDPRPVWRADLDVWMDMDVLVYDLALCDSPILAERGEAGRSSLVWPQPGFRRSKGYCAPRIATRSPTFPILDAAFGFQARQAIESY